MDILSSVSETALVTLKARVVESEKRNPLIEDELGKILLDRIEGFLSEGTGKQILHRKIPRSLSNHIALRASRFDSYAEEFTRNNPEGIIVSLGSGFDTRFWRLGVDPDRYLEVDLPPIIEAKSRLLRDFVSYRMIPGSVLEKDWLEEVLKLRNSNVLFLAEGLFMYLPPADVRRTFNQISTAFSSSLMVLEVVHKRYTSGIWKKMVVRKFERTLGSGAGASYDFGIEDARELESYGENIKVLDEWSYFEDENIRPAFLKLFRSWEFMTRTQWTVRISIK